MIKNHSEKIFQSFFVLAFVFIFSFFSLPATGFLNEVTEILKTSDSGWVTEKDLRRLNSYIEKGNLHQVKIFLKKTQSIHKFNRELKKAILIQSIISKQIEITKFIQSLGVSIDFRTTEGYTPLYFSVIRTNIEAFNLLLDLGSDVNAKEKGSYKNTILQTAVAQFFRFYVVEGSSEYYIVNTLVNHKDIDINAKNTDGNTALHIVTRRVTKGKGNKRLAQLLLQNKNINIDQKNNRRRTPLHESILKSDVRMAKLLLKNGANPKKRAIFSNGYGMAKGTDSEEMKDLLKMFSKNQKFFQKQGKFSSLKAACWSIFNWWK